jgi:hypothetical protein
VSPEADEVFYDRSLSLDERAERLTEMADAGDTQTLGYP